MRRPQAVLSAIAVSTVLAGTALLTADPDPVLLTAGPPAPADCTFFRVTSSGHGLSTLSSIDLAAGTATRVRTLEFRAAALGYANGRIYALTDEGFHPTSRLVTMDTTGRVLSTTPLRDTAHGGFGIRGGAVANGHFHVIAGTTLLSIRLGDAVVDARVHLSLSGLTVDDLAYRPADGRLHGVSTPVLFPGQGRAVRIDPTTGSVTQTGQNPLPTSTSYGSVVLAPDGALYPVSNRTNGRSRVYRLPLTPGASPTETLVLPPADSADASECVPRPAPPTTPPPPPPPTPPPPPPPAPPVPGQPTTTTPAPPTPTTTRPPGAPPAPRPVIPPPPPPPGVPSAPAAPPPPPAPVPAPPAPAPPTKSKPDRVREAVPTPQQRAREATEKKRRWGLTALVLLFGAGAAAASARNGSRHR